MAGMLFFALGLDREVLKLFAQSLDRIPTGAYVFSPGSAETMVHSRRRCFRWECGWRCRWSRCW